MNFKDWPKVNQKLPKCQISGKKIGDNFPCIVTFSVREGMKIFQTEKIVGY